MVEIPVYIRVLYTLEDKDWEVILEDHTTIPTPSDNAVARVSESVSLRATDNEAYDKGRWDRIVYSVEVTSRVELAVEQTDSAIASGLDAAHDIARAHAVEHLNKAVFHHVHNLREELYAELFDD